ncbi:MAG: hypothetical protein HZC49_08860, partial [Nitrospirae bacterium]|nr:hypothetical protein [Nitrospirota bacterium]
METLDNINDDDIDTELIEKISLPFAKGNVVLPLKRENDELFGAVSDSRGVFALRDLARSLNLKPHPVQADEKVIIDAINRIFSRTSRVDEAMGVIKGEDLSLVATEFESPKDLLELTEE